MFANERDDAQEIVSRSVGRAYGRVEWLQSQGAAAGGYACEWRARPWCREDVPIERETSKVALLPLSSY